MRIVIYKDNLTTGRGADRAVLNLASMLADKGNDITIATSGNPATPFSSDVSETVNRCFITRNRPKGFIKILNKLGILNELKSYSKRLSERIADIAPDMIISTGSNEIVELTYATKPLPPIIQQLHTHPEALLKKGKTKFNVKICKAIKNVSAIQVLLPSHVSILRNILSSCLPKETPIIDIGNFPSFGKTVPAADEKNIIAYAAALTPDKQQHMLIKAFSKIAQANPGWQLHLYGTGSKSYTQLLQNAIKENNLQNQVRLKGWCNEISMVYASCAFIAFPSKIEGFGLGIIDAAMFAKPTIAVFSNPAAAELIQSGKTGLLCDCTADALANALQTLISDVPLRHTLGKNAQEYFNENYSKETISTKWLNLLENIRTRVLLRD